MGSFLDESAPQRMGVAMVGSYDRPARLPSGWVVFVRVVRDNASNVPLFFKRVPGGLVPLESHYVFGSEEQMVGGSGLTFPTARPLGDALPYQAASAGRSALVSINGKQVSVFRWTGEDVRTSRSPVGPYAGDRGSAS